MNSGWLRVTPSGSGANLPRAPGKVSSLDSSWGLCASRLKWEKEKRKVALACPCLFPLTRGTEWGPGKGWADWFSVCMFIVCMCTYVWWYCFWDGRECLCDVDFLSVFCWLVWLMLFVRVRTSGYLEAMGPFGEPGPFELPLWRLLRARGPAMQDFCCLWSGPLRIAEAWGWQKLGCLTMMVSQIGILMRQVGLALPPRLVMPSLLQLHTHKQEHIYMVRECVVE